MKVGTAWSDVKEQQLYLYHLRDVACSIILFLSPVILSKNVAWSVDISVFESLLYFPFEAFHSFSILCFSVPFQILFLIVIPVAIHHFRFYEKYTISETPWSRVQGAFAPSCQGSHLATEIPGNPFPYPRTLKQTVLHLLSFFQPEYHSVDVLFFMQC